LTCHINKTGFSELLINCFHACPEYRSIKVSHVKISTTEIRESFIFWILFIKSSKKFGRRWCMFTPVTNVNVTGKKLSYRNRYRGDTANQSFYIKHSVSDLESMSLCELEKKCKIPTFKKLGHVESTHERNFSSRSHYTVPLSLHWLLCSPDRWLRWLHTEWDCTLAPQRYGIPQRTSAYKCWSLIEYKFGFQWILTN
jgi:hypothetical protein